MQEKESLKQALQCKELKIDELKQQLLAEREKAERLARTVREQRQALADHATRFVPIQDLRQVRRRCWTSVAVRHTLGTSCGAELLCGGRSKRCDESK